MLVMGVTLCFCAFWTAPVGEIHDSVLWYFAQCLIYAGSGEIHDSVLWYFAQCLIYAGSAVGIDLIIDERIRKMNK